MNIGQIELIPSRILLGFMLGAHLLAGLLLVLLPMSAGWEVVGVLAVFVSLVLHVVRILRPVINAMRMDAQGRLEVRMRQGAWVAATVTGDSIVLAAVTVLHLRLPGRWATQGLVLLPDMLDAEQFRWLRIRLKWQPHGEAEKLR